MLDIEFISLGNNIEGLPNLSLYPLAKPNATSLYWAKVHATMNVKKKYFCFLDGGGDVLPENFLERCKHMVDVMDENNIAISYGDEMSGPRLFRGYEFTREKAFDFPFILHHAPICRTDLAQSFEWPRGCYWHERLCYVRLAFHSHYYYPGVHYIWYPTPNGAGRWVDTGRAIQNSKNYLIGMGERHKDWEPNIDHTSCFR